MNRISRTLCTALSVVPFLAATPASSQTASQRPIIESASSGLIAFSREERIIRVAAVFAQKDIATVPTLVKFLDSRDVVLKQVRGDLSEGNAVIAELTRADVAGRGDLLVRVEVRQELPGLRRKPYPIMNSVQAIGPASVAMHWNGGTCGLCDPKRVCPGDDDCPRDDCPDDVPDPSSPAPQAVPGTRLDLVGQDPGGLPAPKIPPGEYLVICLPPES